MYIVDIYTCICARLILIIRAKLSSDLPVSPGKPHICYDNLCTVFY